MVLALTLGLGLAVGAAGGYLVGHRSGERAAQRALGGETGTTSATYGDTAPSTPSGADAAAPATDASGESPRPAPAGPSPSAPPALRAGRDRPDAAGGQRRARDAARPSGAAVPATGQLVIRSTPTRAGVMVDGAWRGRTPITVRGLSVGTHTVRVVEDGYVSETRRVAVDARSAGTTVSFQLARVRGPERPAPAVARPGAKTGALRVESRPSGAAVLDRRPRRGDDAAADLRSRAGLAPGAARAAGPPPVGDDRDHRRRAERARRRVARGKH